MQSRPSPFHRRHRGVSSICFPLEMTKRAARSDTSRIISVGRSLMSPSTPEAVTAASSALSEKNQNTPPAVLQQSVAPLRLFRDEVDTFATNYRPAKTDDQCLTLSMRRSCKRVPLGSFTLW